METLVRAGFGLAAPLRVVDAGDDDDTQADPDDPEPPVDTEPPVEPDAPTIDPDTRILTGTDGDDEVVQGGDAYEPDFHTAHLGDGNDTIDAPRGTNVFGEAGDDVIAVVGENAANILIEGGEGDDVITSDALTGRVSGGEGNDTINHSEFHISDNGSLSVEGGAGDDVINAHLRVGRNEQDVDISGGEGADQFNLELDLEGAYLGTDFSSLGAGLSAANIRDFDPTQDQIVVDVGDGIQNIAVEDGTTAAFTYSSWAVRDAGSDAIISVTYALESDPSVTLETTIHIAGAAGLDASMIEVTTPQA